MVTLQHRHATGLISIYISMSLVQSDFVSREPDNIYTQLSILLLSGARFSGTADTDRKCYMYAVDIAHTVKSYTLF